MPLATSPEEALPIAVTVTEQFSASGVAVSPAELILMSLMLGALGLFLPGL